LEDELAFKEGVGGIRKRLSLRDSFSPSSLSAPGIYLGAGGLSLLPSPSNFCRSSLCLPPAVSIVEYAELPVFFSPYPVPAALFLARLCDYNYELRAVWGLQIYSDILNSFSRTAPAIINFSPYSGVNRKKDENFWIFKHPSSKMYHVGLDEFLSSYIRFDHYARPPLLASLLGDFFEEMSIIRDVYRLIRRR